MAQAGEDVTFVDPWPANVEQMKAHGLKVSHIRDVPEWTTPVRAIHPAHKSSVKAPLSASDRVFKDTAAADLFSAHSWYVAPPPPGTGAFCVATDRSQPSIDATP